MQERSHEAAVPARPEMVEARLGRGTYTDDTEMMIVLAESLLEHGSVKDEQLARAFGAMAGAIAGAKEGGSSIPPRWLDALEDGQRGHRHVERLACALALG